MVLFTKALNLQPLTMGGNCQGALLQMGLQSVLEKGGALLSAIPLHVATVRLLQSVHLVAPTIMVEEICTEGIMIGNST